MSQIRTYLTCPQQYQFRHVLGMKSEEVGWSALVGSAIHNVISSWHLRQREPTIERLVDEFTQDVERRREAVWGAGREISGYNGRETLLKSVGEATAMMGGYIEDGRNHVPLVANETRFRVTIQGDKTQYPFAGTIDQARREREGHLHLTDLKTGKMKPLQILLDLDMQLSLYAIALAKGEVERVGDLKVEWGPVNERPAMLSIIHMRDYMPYEKNEFAEFTTHATETEINPETNRKRKKKIPNPRFAGGYKKGDRRGRVFYTTQRSAFDLEQAEKDLSRICAAIKFKMFYRRPVAQGACIGFCRFVAECTADRSAPI